MNDLTNFLKLFGEKSSLLIVAILAAISVGVLDAMGLLTGVNRDWVFGTYYVGVFCFAMYVSGIAVWLWQFAAKRVTVASSRRKIVQQAIGNLNDLARKQHKALCWLVLNNRRKYGTCAPSHELAGQRERR